MNQDHFSGPCFTNKTLRKKKDQVNLAGERVHIEITFYFEPA